MKRTHHARKGAIAGAATLCLLTLAPVAHAQQDVAGPLQLSADGSTYAATLPNAIFSDPPLLVPGESTADSVWARNDSDVSAVISLYAVDADSTLGSDVPADTDFQVLARAGSTERTVTPVSAVDPCAPIAQALLAPGQSTEFALVVALPETSGNVSQRQSVTLDFLVDLRAEVGGGQRCGADPEPAPPGAPEQPPAAGSPGAPASPPAAGSPGSPAGPGMSPLPRTGSEALPLLLAGVLAVLFGAALRRAGREARA